MSDIDLDNLSLSDLKALQKKVAKAIGDFEERRRKEATAAVEAKAKEMGFSLEELMGKKKTSSKAPTPAKYRHPENASLTWSGRGRQPDWYKSAIASGASPDDFLIR